MLLDNKIHGLEIVEYDIEKHSDEVQKLLNEYLVPTYCKRLGITQNERLKYAEVEDILHPNLAKDPKFEKFSLVALDESGEVVGLSLNYMVTKQQFQNNFLNNNLMIGKDLNYKESIRKYCQHRYAVCSPLTKFYDQ